jgi:four helix bundle protein
MPKYQNFEELPVWKEAALLYNRVLDLLEAPGIAFSSGFRNQLDRAALSISNNIAEGFERITTDELLSFLGIARGSGGEVRSMIAVVKDRPKLKPIIRQLQEIRRLADSCVRQLSAWTSSIEASPIQGKRHLDSRTRRARQQAEAAENFRSNFLRNLKPEHPLYSSSEARAAARGEQTD